MLVSGKKFEQIKFPKITDVKISDVVDLKKTIFNFSSDYRFFYNSLFHLKS